MAGANDELDAARASLLRAKDELLRLLEAEPAWRSLREIEQRAQGEGEHDFPSLRRGAMEALDRSVPQWRTLASIERAIAALGAAEAAEAGDGMLEPGAPSSPSAGGFETPGAAPHVRVRAQEQRTRYAPATGRPTAQPAQSAGAGLKSATSAAKRAGVRKVRSETRAALPTEAPGSNARGRGRLGRVAAALGLAGDGAARLSAIEAEVETLIRRDLEATSVPPAQTAAAPLRRVTVPPPTEPSADVRALPDREDTFFEHAEEAEVEIVYLDGPRRKDPSRPITRLADRLHRVAPATPVEEGGEAVISLEATFEEAAVEITTSEGAAMPVAKASPRDDDTR